VARRIAIAADRGGFTLKEYIKKHIDCMDLGTDSAAIPVDYPDFAKKVVGFVKRNRGAMGVLVCRTGTGMMMAANRDKKIRAALLYNRASAEKAREHEDANVAVLASDQFSNRQNLGWLGVFLGTPFSGAARHVRRIRKIS
jgi:ribose 5-phosphate isomerase B